MCMQKIYLPMRRITYIAAKQSNGESIPLSTKSQWLENDKQLTLKYLFSSNDLSAVECFTDEGYPLQFSTDPYGKGAGIECDLCERTSYLGKGPFDPKK